MLGQIYPSELQLNKANSSDAEAQFSDLNLTNSIVSSKIYDKQDDYPYTFLKKHWDIAIVSVRTVPHAISS